MNTSVSDFNRGVVVVRLHHATEQKIVGLISETVDKGITRIKRNALVSDILNMLLSNAVINSAVVPIGEKYVIDTPVCRITTAYNGLNDTVIEIVGNDDVTTPITISTSTVGFTVNGRNFEMQSLIVMVTSLLLKNSQDSNCQTVEVIKS